MIASKIISGREFDIYTLEHDGSREMADFLVALQESNTAEFAKLLRALDRTADFGLIKNDQRFKQLTADIYEFKTYGGIRVLCFLDQRSIVVLTNGFTKRKKYDGEVERAEHLRQAFVYAKTNGCLILINNLIE